MTKTKSLSLTAGIVLATAFTFCGCKEEAKEKKETPSAEATTEAFTDSRDGKKYKTVKIGEQVWMAENLSYDKSNNCYEYKDENCQKYGRLYNEDNAKTACPAGWHLPSDAEWQTLIKFAGGEKVAGKKLKAKSGWNENGNGTDEFGFSALPSGQITHDMSSGGLGVFGRWWTATVSGKEDYYVDGEGPYYRDTWWYYSIEGDGVSKSSGGVQDIFNDQFSVRCVKDK